MRLSVIMVCYEYVSINFLFKIIIYRWVFILRVLGLILLIRIKDSGVGSGIRVFMLLMIFLILLMLKVRFVL